MAQLGPGVFLLFNQPVQAGFRSPLPIPQLSGGTGGQAGFISPLPTIPLGGTDTVTGGVKSMLAFWAGGATSGIEIIIDTETPGYYGTGLIGKRKKQDDEIIALIMAMYESGTFH